MQRRRALVAKERAAQTRVLRRKASEKFARSVAAHSDGVDSDIKHALATLQTTSALRAFRPAQQYHASPFSTQDPDTLEEIGALAGNERPLSALLPRAKFQPDEMLLTTAAFLSRRVEGDLALDVDLDEMLERGRAMRRRRAEEAKRAKKAEERAKKQARREKQQMRSLSSRRRSSAGALALAAADDGEAVVLPHIAGCGPNAALYGEPGRSKFFEDLQRQHGTDFDHQLDQDPARARRKQQLEERRSHRRIRDEIDARGTAGTDKDKTSDNINNNDGAAAPPATPSAKKKKNTKTSHKDGDGFFGRVTYQSSGGGDNLHTSNNNLADDLDFLHLNPTPVKYKQVRQQKLALSRATRSLEDLRHDVEDDCARDSLVGSGEGVHMTEFDRNSMAYEASQSLQGVIRRNRDPRIKYVRRCASEGLLPEPLLVGKAGRQQDERTLDLTHYKVGNKRMLALIPSLHDVKLHRRLLIRDNRLDDSALAPFLDAFSGARTEGNDEAEGNRAHGKEHSAAVSGSGRRWAATGVVPAFVTELDLGENRIGVRTLAAFGRFALAQAATLVALDLTSTKLSDRGAHDLFCKHLAHCHSLTRLNVSRNSLQSNAVTLLADKILATNALPHLQHLNLSWNSITHGGVHAVATSLHCNTTLRTLDLDYNTAGAAAQYFAAPLLQGNTTLTELSLAANSVGGRAALVLGEMLIESSNLCLKILNLDDNPVTTTAAKAFVRVLARGVGIQELRFQSEYTFDRELEHAFDPLHLSLDFEQVNAAAAAAAEHSADTEVDKEALAPKLKLAALDLADPFERAQATMLLRHAAESSGFALRSVRLQDDVTPTTPLDRGGEEIELERKCIDLEGASIKTYKKHFLALCREHNPGIKVRRIQDAFLSASHARDLLVRVHGKEPCDMMIRLIVSAFDVNDDGIIEWHEFEAGIDHAKSLFGPTVRRTGQNPIGTMCIRSQRREWVVPMEGRLVLSFFVTPVPMLPHHESTRVNFRKITEGVIQSSPPRLRLVLIHLLVAEAPVSLDQATRLCKLLEAHPGGGIEFGGDGFVLDNICEVILALTHKSDGATLLSRLMSSTRVALRKHMRGNYRVLVGLYTGRFQIDLGRHQDRMVAKQLVSHYNLRVMNSLRRHGTSGDTSISGHGKETGHRKGAGGDIDTSVCQDGLPFHNVRLDAKLFDMRPYVIMADQAEDAPVLPLPPHGILSFDSFEFFGPHPSIKPLGEVAFRQWIEDLHLESISGVLPTRVIGSTILAAPTTSAAAESEEGDGGGGSGGGDTSASASGIEANTSATIMRLDPNKPTPSRFAKPSEVMMATKISSHVRACLARRKIEGMRRDNKLTGIFASVLGRNGGDDKEAEKLRFDKAAITVQRFYRTRQVRIRAQERREGRLLAPRPPFPKSTPEVPILSKRERRRNFLWPLVPSMRRHKSDHASFWKWCDDRGFNERVCQYNDMNSRQVDSWSTFFYLDAAGRSHLSNKVNFILERISTICLTCQQLRQLISKLPARVVGSRSETAVSCFNRLVDPKNFEVQVMSLLSAREKDVCMKRLGALNIFDPQFSDRQYVLDLAVPSEKVMAELLVDMGKKEGRGRHFFYQSFFQPALDQVAGGKGGGEEKKGTGGKEKKGKKKKDKKKKGKKKGKKKKGGEEEGGGGADEDDEIDEDEDEDLETAFNFHEDPRFTDGLPTDGVFSFRYGVPHGPTAEVRQAMLRKYTYAGRVEWERDHFVREIDNATTIQAVLRGSLARMRYARTQHIILQVQFAHKRDRQSATKIQKTLRGYWLRERLKRARIERQKQIMREQKELQDELEARQRRHQSTYAGSTYSAAALSGGATRRRRKVMKRKASVANLPLNYLGVWGNSQAAGATRALKQHFTPKEKARRNSVFVLQAVSGGGK